MEPPRGPALVCRIVAITAALLLCIALSGCAGIAVHQAPSTGLLSAWKASVAAEDQLSPRSLQTFRRLDLEPIYVQNPAQAVRQLHVVAEQDPSPDNLFALAEACFLLGKQAEDGKVADACAYYYLSAGYSYHYLFDGPKEVDPLGAETGTLVLTSTLPNARCSSPLNSPFDPRYRLACDLYNNALAKCIRSAQKVGRLDPRKPLEFRTPDGRNFRLSVQHHNLDWKPEEIDPWLFCQDYAVTGLSNHYSTYGLGVPLVGCRASTGKAPGSAFYPRDLNFPATAFFRFEGPLSELGNDRTGRLDIYNPLTTQTIVVRGRTIPLESDLTTPLAYFLAKTDLASAWYTGYLKPDSLEKKSGIYMLEPYKPGKIPVLMVHGLLSSPLTWATMFNDLRGDPELREHFQFWFYLYPTGSPYLTTAAELRQNLVAIRQAIDADHSDPTLDHMVCIGHSMGGLVSRLLTTSSKDDFWRLVSSTPFDKIKAKPRSKQELEQAFFFEQQPYVDRVIFLGTPHHGSKLSPSAVARIGDYFVHSPQTLMQAFSDVSKENPDAKLAIDPERIPTSVDLLAPGASALEVLAARPVPEGVHLHSIIGDAPQDNTLRRVSYVLGEKAERSDGIVPYTSAHLPSAESELVVTADHMTVHQHPLAVREVRRILFNHLIDLQKRNIAPTTTTGPAATIMRPIAEQVAVPIPLEVIEVREK